MGPPAQIVIEFEGGQTFLSQDGARSGLILLATMLASFLAIRTSARLMRSDRVPWWPGSIKSESGLHVHHLVFGIVMMLLGGFALALQPVSPWAEIFAATFGIGAGLTLDEFALWLHLEDVYWSEQGRRSVDAVVIAALVGGLVLLGFLPITTDDGIGVIVGTVLVNLALAAISIAKGKIVLAVVGMLFPIASLIGAIRLAKPESPWAKRLYEPGGGKMAKAVKRAERHSRRYRRFQDQIAGAPHLDGPKLREPPPAGPD